MGKFKTREFKTRKLEMRGFKMRKFEFKLFRGKKMISRARSFKTHQKSAEEQLDKKED